MSFGGDDSYQNLIIVHKDVHKPIHVTVQETTLKCLHVLIIKVNGLWKLANLKEIQI